jgi:hypothetical protein
MATLTGIIMATLTGIIMATITGIIIAVTDCGHGDRHRCTQ